jgi:sarcosine oxidase, subunit gamma
VTAESAGPHSPLEHLTVELAETPPGVGITELPFLTQFNLRVDPTGPAARSLEEVLVAALPTQPNTAVATGDLTVLWLGPDEWLVVAPAGRQETLEKALRQAIGTEPGAVVDLSAHRTTVELTGERASEVLAKGCSLDLHPAVFTPGSCAQVLLAQAPVLLLGRDGDAPTYWLLVRASFATYVAAWLLDACLEYTAASP